MAPPDRRRGRASYDAVLILDAATEVLRRGGREPGLRNLCELLGLEPRIVRTWQTGAPVTARRPTAERAARALGVPVSTFAREEAEAS